MQKCLQMPQGSVHICRNRQISLFQGTGCSNNELPPTLVVELDKTLILLKTDSKSIVAKCPNSTKNIESNSTIIKIKLGLSCKLMSNSFMVSAYSSFETEDFSIHPLEVIELHEFPSFEHDINPSKYNEINHTFANHSSQMTVLKNDLKQVEKDSSRIEQLFDNPSFVPFSSKILIGVIITICLLYIGYKVKTRFFDKSSFELKKKAEFSEIESLRQELQSEIADFKKWRSKLRLQKNEDELDNEMQKHSDQLSKLSGKSIP